MAANPEAYVDTSAFIAFTDGSDTHHALFARLFAAPPRLVTTSLVVAEGHGWFLRRFDRTRNIAAATRLMRRLSDQDLTLADAVGLHLTSVRKTRSCWSTDRHLRLTAIPLVIDHT